MPSGVVEPPTNDLGLSSGSSDDEPPPDNRKRNLIIAGAAGLGLVLIYLYAKSRSSSSSSSTTAAPQLVTPASNQDTTMAGLASGIEGGLNGIAGTQSSILAAIQGLGSTAPGTPPPAPVTGNAVLPPVNAANYPRVVPYGSYSSDQYTQIGTVTNGVYNGSNVGGGVPVYTNIYGGFAQGAFPTSGSYGVYIPSQFKAYDSALV